MYRYIEKMQFVVHYHFTNTDYSELKALTDNQYERLIEAKEIRLAATSKMPYLLMFDTAMAFFL